MYEVNDTDNDTRGNDMHADTQRLIDQSIQQNSRITVIGRGNGHIYDDLFDAADGNTAPWEDGPGWTFWGSTSDGEWKIELILESQRESI